MQHNVLMEATKCHVTLILQAVGYGTPLVPHRTRWMAVKQQIVSLNTTLSCVVLIDSGRSTAQVATLQSPGHNILSTGFIASWVSLRCSESYLTKVESLCATGQKPQND